MVSSDRLSFPQHGFKNLKHCTHNPAMRSSTFRFTSRIENHSCRFSDEHHVKLCNKYGTLILIEACFYKKHRGHQSGVTYTVVVMISVTNETATV